MKFSAILAILSAAVISGVTAAPVPVADDPLSGLNAIGSALGSALGSAVGNGNGNGNGNAAGNGDGNGNSAGNGSANGNDLTGVGSLLSGNGNNNSASL